MTEEPVTHSYRQPRPAGSGISAKCCQGKIVARRPGEHAAIRTFVDGTVLQELARAGIVATAQLLLSHAKIRMTLEAASQA